MPVYKDKQRGTWYISTSYTPKKGFYKKKTVRGFKKKSDALNYERVIMIQLKQKAKYNFVLGLKLEDVWKEYSDYMRLTEWKDSTYNANSCIYKKHIKPYFLGRDLLEAHDWKIYDGGTSWEIEQYSPAGEDFVFCIQHDKSLEKAVEQICEYAMNFDQEEHIAMWLEARTVDDNRMNVPSPSELVEDAKEIQGMLDELDYVLDNCTLMEKKQETDIELEEEMEDIEK